MNESVATTELQRRNRELLILNSIAAAMNGSVDLDAALHSALAQVADLLDLETGWVWLLREDTGESYLAAAQNLPPALACNPHSMEGSCYCLDTYAAGDLNGAANINVVTCSRLKNLVDGTGGLRYHASIPLYAHQQKLGVMNVASTDWRELSPDDLRLLHTIGDLLSIAVERARLYARSTELGMVEERNRLARELHDTLAQGLTAVLLQLETADALLDIDSDHERVRHKLHQALAMTRANLDEARRSVLDLRAAPLEGCTLAEALASLVDSEAQRATLQIELHTTGAYPLGVRVETGLYRIAQEALTNIVRHANAGHVALHLTTTPTHTSLVIEDDGIGFDPTQPVQGHFGLVGLNERARLLGGTLQVQSTPGAGTRISVRIPQERAT